MPVTLPPRRPLTPAGLAERWKEYGTRDLAARGWRKLRERVLPPPSPAAPEPPRLTDERTIAQFRVLTNLIGHLDRAAREAIQRRRRRSDREIFARFPLYLVPTYPGDDPFFATAPSGKPLSRCYNRRVQLSSVENAMSEVEQLEQQIQNLPAEDLAKFRAWFLDFDSRRWDQQIEEDYKAGRLDSLISEALEDLKAGRARDL